MKKLIGLLLLMAASPGFGGSVPNQITYQGTLKESGVPVNGTRNMQFRLTNSDGTAVYWSGGTAPVTVTQGLFSSVLSPAGVDWQNVTPYIEVSVEGQLLLPREPVTSNAYALECGSIVDGSVLSGMIAMFAGNCPTGWTRFAALDGLFPMGGVSYGATGGSATHSHTTPDHQHNLALTQKGINAGCFAGPVGVASGGGQSGMVGLPSGANCLYDQVGNYTTVSGGGTTGAASSLPPYLTVVFCQKS